jgi:solute carrier family 25 (mitochondrial phosphate transporter), member 23/24/25/41
MWETGGLRAYYRGLTLGLLGVVPYSALDLGCFEAMKSAYKRAMTARYGGSYDDVEPGIFFQFDLRLGSLLVLCMGALSGSFGASVVFPLNLLVSRVLLLFI